DTHCIPLNAHAIYASYTLSLHDALPIYPRLDLLARQRPFDEPGTPLDEGDAAPIVGQALDAQALFLAHRNLRFPFATAGLEAQAAAVTGHQLLQPVGKSPLISVRRRRRSTGSGRPGRR